MSKKVFFILFASFITYHWLNLTPISHSKSDQPPQFQAGDAVNQASCSVSGCHVGDNNVNNGEGSTTIILGDNFSTYMPGQTYPVSITIERPSAAIFGFQMVAFGEDNKSLGSFIADESQHTAIQTSSSMDIEYINHFNAPTGTDSYTFNLEWEAPEAGSGPVLFSASGNAGNDGNGAMGDFVYTTSLTVEESTDVGIIELENEQSILVSSNGQQLLLQGNLSSIQELQLLDIQGKIIQDQIPVQNQVALNTLSPGVYFVRLQIAGAYFVERILLGY